MASRTKWKRLKKLLCFWKRNKVQPFTDEFQGNEEADTERLRLLDLSWEAWRQGQKIEQDLSDVQTSTTLCRRFAITEELEKHVWHKGHNLREIRRCICVIVELSRTCLNGPHPDR